MSDLQHRTLIFDQVKADALRLCEALEPADFDPSLHEVVTHLGGLVENLFLPDVRHGVAEVPQSYQETNGFGYVPLLPHEEGVRYGLSFYQATPDRIRFTAAQSGLPEEVIEEEAKELVNELAGLPDRRPMVTPKGAAKTWVTHLRWQVDDVPYHLVTRPLVVTRTSTPPSLLHEAVHGYDSQRAWTPIPPTEQERIMGEIRGEIRAFPIGAGAADKADQLGMHHDDGYQQRIGGYLLKQASPLGLAVPTPNQINRLLSIGYTFEPVR